MPKPDAAHLQTDKELAKLEKRIAKIYKEAADDLQKTIDDYFAKFAKRDAKQKARLEAGEITEQEYKQWRLAQMGRGERFKALQSRVAERYTEANETAVRYVNDATPGIYSLNRNYSAYTIEKVAGNVGFDLWDEQTVKRLIVDNPELMPYYPPEKALNRGIDLAYGKKQISASVTSSILQGKSIPRIAKDLQTRMPDMNKASAIRTARTAVTGAQNAGRMDSYVAAEKMGIKVRKEWLATIDGRTRHSHAMLDGKVVDKDKKFENGCMFPGDPNGAPEETYNCRCTLIAAVDSVDTSDAKRRARDPETGESVLIENMSYAEWAGWKEKYEKQKLGKEKWSSLPDDITDRAKIIDKLLTEETGNKSVFNGKVIIDDSIKFNGTANYDGSITLHSNASRKTEIHELLHQHSEGGQNKVYVSIFKNIEEGSVELLAQEICHAKGIKIGQFDYSYTPYVDALRQINKLSGAYKTDYDFAKAVFGKPLEKRAEFLKSLGDRVAKDEKRFFRGALKTLGVK